MKTNKQKTKIKKKNKTSLIHVGSFWPLIRTNEMSSYIISSPECYIIIKIKKCLSLKVVILYSDLDLEVERSLEQIEASILYHFSFYIFYFSYGQVFLQYLTILSIWYLSHPTNKFSTIRAKVSLKPVTVSCTHIWNNYFI